MLAIVGSIIVIIIIFSFISKDGIGGGLIIVGLLGLAALIGYYPLVGGGVSLIFLIIVIIIKVNKDN